MSIDQKKIQLGYPSLNFSQYANYLKMVGGLSRLFSDSDKPYIAYRFAERLYVKCHALQAGITDLSRHDNSFDAMFSFNNAGIGVKTFVDSASGYKDEKVAEFTALSKTEDFKKLRGLDLVIKAAENRNLRVLSDAHQLGIDLGSSIYHCLIRGKGCAFIHEEPYPLIEVNKIQPCDSKGNLLKEFQSEKDLHFTDGLNHYKYSSSKNVLYKRFYNEYGCNSDLIPIHIIDDPFDWFQEIQSQMVNIIQSNLPPPDTREFIVLPLAGARTAHTDSPRVEPKSGLNQWNAAGRDRTFGEAYIPVPRNILDTHPTFFPITNFGQKGVEKSHDFELKLPDRRVVVASLCQQDLKALMSNHNVDLADWLYALIDGSKEKALTRFVASRSPHNRPYTYDDLIQIGKDSVAILKNSDSSFEMKILPLGAYRFYYQQRFKFKHYDDFERQFEESEEP